MFKMANLDYYSLPGVRVQEEVGVAGYSSVFYSLIRFETVSFSTPL